MRQIRYCIWLSLSVCMFLVGGWQSTPGTPMVITLGPGGFELIEDSGYTDAERDRACEPIVPFDGETAFDLHPDSQPILWTFIVNFDLVSPTTANPVGCLRLYHRMPLTDTRGTFEAIDGGGILVDTCTVGPTGTVLLDGSTAAFDAGGHVQCAMNIQAWVRDRGLQDHLICSPDRCDLPANESFHALASGLANFVTHSLHGYQSFTMVAKLTEIIPPSVLPLDVPILFYEDEAPLWVLVWLGFRWEWWPWYFNQSMSIRFVSNGVTFPENTCNSPLFILSPLKVPQTWKHYFTESLSLNNWTYMYETENESERCIPPVLTPSLLWFTIGPATLYIGNTPTSSTFKGSLDGIMIDPTDSRPPKVAD